VTEVLYPVPIPEPGLAGPVQELLGYPQVLPGSNLVPLEPVSVDDLDAAWQELLQQMRASGIAWRTGEPTIPQLSAYHMNGAASAHPERRRSAAAKTNGTSRRGAK
jgi:hypothetical protein